MVRESEGQARHMNVKDIAAAIQKIAPLELAQDRDNVGLLISDPQSDIKNVLMTINITKNVLYEAKKQIIEGLFDKLFKK